MMERRALQIILLPGAGGLNAQFRTFAARCSRELPVIVLDYPDWTWQIKHPGFEQLTSEMTIIISRYFAAGPVAIAGYSLGAHIAAQVTESFSDIGNKIPWIALIEPMVAKSTGIGANVTSRLTAGLLESAKKGIPALASRIWILMNRAGARFILPLLIRGGVLPRIAAYDCRQRSSKGSTRREQRIHHLPRDPDRWCEC
jgi:thioesterase domain-containing protein